MHRPLVPALGAILLSAGCLGFLGREEVAPDGLARPEHEIRRLLSRGRASEALERLDAGEIDPGDDLLGDLYRGVLAHYAGAHDESVRALDRVVYETADRVTRSVTREGLSLLSSDAVLDFRPSTTERLLVHYFGALSWLRLGEPDEAGVEARRLSLLLQRLDEEDPPAPEEVGLRAFLHRFAGTIFEIAGEEEDAGVAHRRAAALARPGGAEEPATVGPDVAAGTPWGTLVVLVETGFVAHRVERSVTVPLTAREARSLDAGSGDERVALATCISGALLGGDGASAGERDGGPWNRRYERESCRGEPRRGLVVDGDDYLLRVAWPRLRQVPLPPGRPALVVGRIRTSPRARGDVTAGVRRDFEEGALGRLSRAVLRGAAKYAVAETLEDEVSKEDETAGKVVGGVVNLGTALLERADTRSWHLLPGRIHLLRATVPPGTHVPVVELEGDGGSPLRSVEMEPVAVPPGGVVVASVRIWR